MLDFEKLEKKCKKYKRKRYLYFSIAFILIAFFIYGGYKVFLNKKKSNHLYVKNIEKIKDEHRKNIRKNIVKKNQNKKMSETNISKILVKESSKEKSQTLQNRECLALQFLSSTKKYIYFVNRKKRYLEKLGFKCYIKESIQDKNKVYLRCNRAAMQESLKKYIKLAENNALSFFIVKEECIRSKISSGKINKKEFKKTNRQKKVAKKEKKIIETKRISKLNSKIEKQKSVERSLLQVKTSTIKDLENLFKQKKTYDLAVKISEEYFKKKSFKNSLKWAKIANNIDNEDEKSWILYAKSLYNLGDKKSAIAILKVFLEYKSSKNATKLLKEWTKK